MQGIRYTVVRRDEKKCIIYRHVFNVSFVFPHFHDKSMHDMEKLTGSMFNPFTISLDANLMPRSETGDVFDFGFTTKGLQHRCCQWPQNRA